MGSFFGPLTLGERTLVVAVSDALGTPGSTRIAGFASHAASSKRRHVKDVFT